MPLDEMDDTAKLQITNDPSDDEINENNAQDPEDDEIGEQLNRKNRIDGEPFGDELEEKEILKKDSPFSIIPKPK